MLWSGARSLEAGQVHQLGSGPEQRTATGEGQQVRGGKQGPVGAEPSPVRVTQQDQGQGDNEAQLYS